MTKILFIEDDLEIQELLKDYLLHYDFHLTAFANPLEGIAKQKTNHYDLVILDLMLPIIDGFEVCKKIRQESNIPIIISSARGNLGDKVLAFEYGADDYLAKPYEPKELLIRIQAILRRSNSKNHTKQIGEFVVDEDKMEISHNGYSLELTKIEYEIFSFLLHNSQKVLSRESISQHIQSEQKDRAIDMHISNIRNKIFDDPKSPKYIKSIWGVGYKFIG